MRLLAQWRLFFVFNLLISSPTIAQRTQAMLWANEPFSSYSQKSEIVEKRDANSKHFRNDDGTITAFIAAGSINYFENGEWKTIFHTIEKQPNGFSNTHNTVKTYYPESASGQIKTVLPGGFEVNELLGMKMYFRTGNSIEQVRLIDNIQGVAEFNRLNYQNAYGNGIDLQFTQNTNQRKMDYVISSLGDLGYIPLGSEFLIFEESVQLPSGWSAELIGNEIHVKDASGALKMIYEKPIFKDSPVHTHEEELTGTVDHTACSAGHNGHELVGNYEIEFVGGLLKILTKVPVSWLTDVNRTFPVVIDPTVNCDPDNTENWTGHHITDSDNYSYVEGSANYTSTNIVSSVNGMLSQGKRDDRVLYSWMKFNISNLSDDACITGASVNYFVNYNYSSQSACGVWTKLRHMSTDPSVVFSSGNDQTRLSDIRDGDIFTDQNLNVGSTSGWKNVPLNANLTHLTNQLTANWFAIGLQTYKGALDHDWCYWEGDGYSSSNKPYLAVSYVDLTVDAGPDLITCGGTEEMNATVVGPLSTQTIYSQNFTGVSSGSIPVNWNRTHNNWSVNATANAGGASPELRFYYSPTATAIFRVRSEMISTTGYTGLNLSFRHSVDHYSGGYTLRVQTSPDGTNWTNRWNLVNPGNQTGIINVDLSALDGTSFYVAFVFDGNSNNIDYWYIDNILLSGLYPDPITYSWSPSTGLSSSNVLNPNVLVGSTTTYTLTATSLGCSKSDQVTVTVQAPAGDPAVFGNNVWNVYGYNGDNTNLASNFYRGYYIQPNLGGGNHGVNTQQFWGNGNSPSDAGVAINTGNIWNGCTVNPDYHTVVQKRKGFPCGTYNLNMQNWDDETRVYLDGSLIWSCTAWSGAGTCPTGNIGMFMLDGDSELEIRSFEQVGGSNVEMSVIAVTPTQLSVNGSTRTCRVSGGNSFIFFQDDNGRLIAGINPQNQDLGYVTMTSYVDGTNAMVPACDFPTNTDYMISVMQRHWVIDKTNPAATPVEVGLPFTNAELGSLVTASNSNSNVYDNVSVIGEVVLSKYHGPNNVNSSALDNCAVSGGNENTTLYGQTGNGDLAGIFPGFVATSYATYSVPDFSEFWLHGSSNLSPLPVTLTSFAAVCGDEGAEVSLKWTTASENNSSHFTVERSMDGNEWEAIGSSQAAGNSTSNINYELTDADTRGHELIYYRLNQYDLNGAFERFGPVTAECSSDQNGFTLFPNPAGTEVSILLKGDFEDGTELIFTDINGKEVKRVSYFEQNGKLITVDLQALEHGVYIVKLANGESNQFVRLIKQ